MYLDRAPYHLKRRKVLAMAQYERRLVYVFVKDLADYLRLGKGDPRFRIALGRTIAHELEHVQRETDAHDLIGLFKACLTRDEMLRRGWGR